MTLTFEVRDHHYDGIDSNIVPVNDGGRGKGTCRWSHPNVESPLLEVEAHPHAALPVPYIVYPGPQDCASPRVQPRDDDTRNLKQGRTRIWAQFNTDRTFTSFDAGLDFVLL